MNYVQQFAELSLQERTEAIAKILSDRAVAILSEKIELTDEQKSTVSESKEGAECRS